MPPCASGCSSTRNCQRAKRGMPRCHRVAREYALPFDPLIPNEATIAAMKEARSGKLETVTLSDLQAVLDAQN